MRHVRALLVVDEPDQERALRELLTLSPSATFAVHRVDHRVEGQELGGAFDVSIVDIDACDARGLATLEAVRQRAPDVPTVVLTGPDDGAASLALERGAEDHLPRSQVDAITLTRAVCHAIDRHGLRQARLDSARVALEREQCFRSLFDNHPDAVVEVGADGRTRYGNPAATKLWTPNALNGSPAVELADHADRELLDALLAVALRGSAAGRHDVRLRTGRETPLIATVTVMPIGEGAPLDGGAFVVLRDVTERRAAQAAAQQLAAIVRSTDLAIISIDVNGRVVTWNAGAQRMFGFASADVVDTDYTQLLDPGDHERWRSISNRVLAGSTVSADVRGRHRAGRWTDVRATASPTIDPSGRVTGLSVIARDVGHEKAAQRALAASERRFRLLADNAQDIVYLRLFRPHPHHDYVSPSLLPVLGYDPVECYRDPDFIRTRVHPDDLELLMAGRVATRDRTVSTYRVRHADGGWRWMENHTSPVVDDSGEVIGRQGISRDVTARVVAEQKVAAYTRLLESANEELRTANRLRDELLSVVSHELRTPLTPILGVTQLLLRRCPQRADADHVPMIEMVDRNARRMLRLVDELITVSLATAGALRPAPQHVCLGSAVREALADLGARDVQVEVVSEDGAATVLFDREHLVQVVTNLVDNARRYGAPPIVVDVAKVDGHARLSVRDNGDGVPGEFVGHLFERFSQASTGDTRTAAGMGLGLYLVRQLVRSNGAEIGYSRNEPNGACFTVTMPLASVDAVGEPPSGDVTRTTALRPGYTVGTAPVRHGPPAADDVVGDGILARSPRTVDERRGAAGGPVVRPHPLPGTDHVSVTAANVRRDAPVFAGGRRHWTASVAAEGPAGTASLNRCPAQPPPIDWGSAGPSGADVVALIELPGFAPGTAHTAGNVTSPHHITDLETMLGTWLDADDRVVRISECQLAVLLRDTDVAAVADRIERLRHDWRDARGGSLRAVLVPASHRDVSLDARP